jgi:DNA-binding protein YbaB
MFDKIMQAQQMAGEVKKRLDTIMVSGVAEGGMIKVTANGIAINKAMEQADNVSQSEMAAMTKDMLGGLGGLF